MSEAEGVDARFSGRLGGFALDVALAAPARGVTALYGPSGSGKTTLLRCIAGLNRFRDGWCRVNGEIWQDGERLFLPTHRRPLGYVFQESSLFAHLSVKRNLRFGQAVGARADAPAIAWDEAIELFGLAPLLDRAPRDLSGGERQRVALARALLTQPRLLLMDEPLASLDAAAKEEILPFLEKLRDRLALPMLYVTHDIAEVERLADRLVLMDKGRVLASGPLAALQSDPALPLAGARTAAVTLSGTIEAVDGDFGLTSVAVRGASFVASGQSGRIGERRRLRIAAGDVSIAVAKPEPSSILNVLPARIVAMEAATPNELAVILGLGEDGAGERILSRITRRSWERLHLAVGASVYAQIKGVALSRGDADA
ncbi:MAG: molybdenum ABC transporter ATP-binding protein [Bradyrhizobium sp.]|nr:MAG: molybdenum ABC transporter ATP-binding protein [Bradyrhizobium sp.]